LLIVLMAAVGTVAWLLFGRSEEVMALEVSPLVSHVDDARAEDLAIGVHQELVHRLVPIPRLEVTSAPGDAAGPPTGFHLSGTLRDGPDGQLRIGIQLDESGRTIWSKNHDVARADIAEAQTTVAFDTARAMREVVSWFYDWREEDDPQTSLALLRARLAFDATPASVEQTLSYFDQALRRDPDNVFALTGKASAYLTSANWFLMDMREAIEEVEPLIDRALAIDADLGPALAQRAMIRLYNGNYAAAGRAIERAKQHAVAAYPVHVSDLLAVTCGRFDEALALIDRALEIDPTNPMLKVQKGQYLWLARRFGEALAVLDDVLAESPYQPRVLEFKGYVLESLGRFEEAYAIGQWREFATEAYARYGPEGLGHVLVEQAAATEKGLTPFPPQMAWRLYVWGYARLGEPAEAVEKMREGWALGDRFEFFYNRTYAWPGFDAFRASSQFQALMRETIGNPDMCPGYRS
jgi:tetratricopeptide (TPR) repeat protein